MAAAARKGDRGIKHKTVYTINQGSGDVFINGRPAARVRDQSTFHAGHISKIVSGSPDVFVNGRALARVGDPLSLCTKIAPGASPDVSAN
jgi:uncharacterized Zn-binding protein involved in type VI secretion